MLRSGQPRGSVHGTSGTHVVGCARTATGANRQTTARSRARMIGRIATLGIGTPLGARPVRAGVRVMPLLYARKCFGGNLNPVGGRSSRWTTRGVVRRP